MDFWESLLSLKTDPHEKDVIITRDFNTTKSSLEKRGGSIIKDPFGEKLEDLMENLDLLDPMPKNVKYTWNNKRDGLKHITTRLNHFLVSTTFIQKDFLPSSHIISSATSDHKLISLSFSLPSDLGPIPFRFNPLWLKHTKNLDSFNLEYHFFLAPPASFGNQSLGLLALL